MKFIGFPRLVATKVDAPVKSGPHLCLDLAAVDASSPATATIFISKMVESARSKLLTLSFAPENGMLR